MWTKIEKGLSYQQVINIMWITLYQSTYKYIVINFYEQEDEKLLDFPGFNHYNGNDVSYYDSLNMPIF